MCQTGLGRKTLWWLSFMTSAMRDTKAPAAHARPARSIALVSIAFAVVLLWRWLLPTTPFAAWQRQHLHWNYGFQAIFFSIPLVLLLAGARSPADYGLRLAKPAFHLRLLLVVAVATVLVPLMVEWLWGRLMLDRTFARHTVSTLAFHFVFSSFGEELFFRGFAQGELNRGLGRPWRFGAARFGPSLIVVTLLFAAGHASGHHHSLGNAISAVVLAGCFAFFAGLLREYTGGIWAPCMLHAGIDFNAHIFQPGATLWLAGFICTGLVFWLIIGALARAPLALRVLTSGEPPEGSTTTNAASDSAYPIDGVET